MSAAYKIFICCLLLLLSSCGFHLRGTEISDRRPPFNNWQVENADLLRPYIENEIVRRSDKASLQADNNHKTGILHIINMEQGRDIQTFNNIGGTAEYLLWLRVDAQFMYQDKILGAPFRVYAQRVVPYSDSTMLGSQQEENLVRQDIYRDAARQIVRRMSFISVPKEK